ncbi:MAG: response regulator [Cyanobacteria bacterium P01_F01_bin.150]
MLQFQPGDLGGVITELQGQSFCGTAHVDVVENFNDRRQHRFLIFHQGDITYGGDYIPNPNNFSTALANHFKLPLIREAFQLAKKKVNDQTSIRQYLELYIQLNLLSWQDIETFIRNNIVLMLERVFSCSGKIELNPSSICDLSYGADRHGFTWNQLNHDLMQRRQVWASLAPAVPSMDAIPRHIDGAQLTITDPWIQQHLEHLVDGRRSIFDIAQHLGRDPLELAHTYLHFVQMGWINFSQAGYVPTLKKAVVAKSTFPTVLSVDDSRVVQTMIKRNICDRYNVLLAGNAVDALNLLNTHNVQLMLLDVTMPDIDGLEFCRTIRSINKFRNLPVIMLTAKDGMFNKIKGQMAGSTHYLTKPVDRQKLLDVLQRYIPSPIPA